MHRQINEESKRQNDKGKSNKQERNGQVAPRTSLAQTKKELKELI